MLAIQTPLKPIDSKVSPQLRDEFIGKRAVEFVLTTPLLAAILEDTSGPKPPTQKHDPDTPKKGTHKAVRQALEQLLPTVL